VTIFRFSKQRIEKKGSGKLGNSDGFDKQVNWKMNEQRIDGDDTMMPSGVTEDTARSGGVGENLESLNEAFEKEVEKLVRDEEQFSVFFQMLKMGVPLPAVMHKMVQKDLNPQIIELGEEAPLKQALALQREFKKEKDNHQAPVKRGETIRFEAIAPERIIGKDTVFAGLGVALEKDSLENIKDLLELFQKREPPKDVGTSPSTVNATRPARVRKDCIESVLDGRRAQAISIAIKKLKVSVDNPAKFAWALREMNENVINAQAIQILNSCPLWPISPEEHRVLVNKKGVASNKAAEPDRVLLYMIETVPDVSDRVSLMSFRWEFEESIVDTCKSIADVIGSSMATLAHKNLKVVVRAAMLMGNAMNQATSESYVKGCSLNSLIRLSTIKSNRDKTFTVLDSVAGYCVRCYPDFSSLTELAPLATAAKKVDLTAASYVLRDMKKRVESIRRLKQLERFSKEATIRLAAADDQLKLSTEAFNRCLEYFGIYANDMDVAMFFDLFLQFLQAWDKSLSKLQKIEKAKAAAVSAAIAAEKAAVRAAKRAAEKAAALEKLREITPSGDSNSNTNKRITNALKGLFVRKSRIGTKTSQGRQQQDGFQAVPVEANAM